jgi:predicted Fe-S protein YdhL (DUF1289 family)
VTDEIWRRDEIESPCVKLCVIHPRADICAGCFRTPDEIARWSAITPAERRAVMVELPAREGLLTARTGRRRNINRDG